MELPPGAKILNRVSTPCRKLEAPQCCTFRSSTVRTLWSGFPFLFFEVDCHASRVKITARVRFAVDSAITPVVRFNLTMASCLSSTLPKGLASIA